MADKKTKRQAGPYLKETVAYTHPTYDALFDTWEFYRRAYQGGDDFVRNYLIKHPSESPKAFDVRLERAVYENHVRQIVETYAAQLFQQPIPREATNAAQAEVLDPFWQDITNTGVSADEFYEGVAQQVATYGVVHLLVDKYNGADEYDEAGQIVPPSNRLQELERGVRPYVYAIEPHNLINWQVDTRGEYVWAVVRSVYTPPAEFNNPTPDPEYRYTLWTRTTHQTFTVETESSDAGGGEASVSYMPVTEEQPHGLGEVPIVSVFFGKRRGVDPVADPMIRDIAPLARRLMNLRSWIDEELATHVFNILVVGTQAYDKIEGMQFSVAGTLCAFDDEPEPKYLSPDSAPVESLQSQIASTEGSIRLLSGLGRQNESNSAESGVALAYKNVDKAALYKRFGQILTDLEEKVDGLALRWLDNASADLAAPVAPAVYQVELDPGTVQDTISNVARITALPTVTPSVAKEALALLVNAVFKQHLAPEQLQELRDSVESEFQVTTLPNALTAFASNGTT